MSEKEVFSYATNVENMGLALIFYVDTFKKKASRKRKIEETKNLSIEQTESERETDCDEEEKTSKTTSNYFKHYFI